MIYCSIFYRKVIFSWLQEMYFIIGHIKFFKFVLREILKISHFYDPMCSQLNHSGCYGKKFRPPNSIATTCSPSYVSICLLLYYYYTVNGSWLHHQCVFFLFSVFLSHTHLFVCCPAESSHSPVRYGWAVSWMVPPPQHSSERCQEGWWGGGNSQPLSWNSLKPVSGAAQATCESLGNYANTVLHLCCFW